MKYNFEIVTLEPAKEDMDNTINYITQQLKAPKAASDLFDKIEETISNIQTFPFSCPPIKRKQNRYKNIRYAIIDNYILFYKVNTEKNIIEILRFIYGAMDLEKHI